MTRKQHTIHIATSQFDAYTIADLEYNGRPARVLYGSRHSMQSGVALDDEPELLFHYNQRFLELIMSVRPSKLLVLGGGTCTLPAAIHALFPDIVMDVIERDELLLLLARAYFSLPESPNIRLHVVDGMEFVHGSLAEQYDMIITDVFDGSDIPFQFFDIDAYKTYRRIMKPDAVFAANIVTAQTKKMNSVYHELREMARSSFQNVSYFQADQTHKPTAFQNMLLVASDVPLQFDYLQSDCIE